MKSVRGLAIGLAVATFVTLGVVLGVFLWENNHWVILTVPTLKSWIPLNVEMVSEQRPLNDIMLFCTFVGALLATVIYTPMWLRRSVERGRNRRFIKSIEHELTGLRNLPVTDPAPLEDIEEAPRGDDEKLSEEEEEALLLATIEETPEALQRGPTR